MRGTGEDSSQGTIHPQEAFCACMRACFGGSADHTVMVAAGVVRVNKGAEVAVALQWKRGACRLLLFRNWAYAMIS